VKPSNFSRALKEEQSLIKTEDRLSRNLNDEDFTDAINEETMRLAAPKIADYIQFIPIVERDDNNASGHAPSPSPSPSPSRGEGINTAPPLRGGWSH